MNCNTMSLVKLQLIEERYGIVWVAGYRHHKHLIEARKHSSAIDAVKVEDICAKIIEEINGNQRNEMVPLKTIAQLLFGVINIYSYQVKHLYNQAAAALNAQVSYFSFLKKMEMLEQNRSTPKKGPKSSQKPTSATPFDLNDLLEEFESLNDENIDISNVYFETAPHESITIKETMWSSCLDATQQLMNDDEDLGPVDGLFDDIDGAEQDPVYRELNEMHGEEVSAPRASSTQQEEAIACDHSIEVERDVVPIVEPPIELASIPADEHQDDGSTVLNVSTAGNQTLNVSVLNSTYPCSLAALLSEIGSVQLPEIDDQNMTTSTVRTGKRKRATTVDRSYIEMSVAEVENNDIAYSILRCPIRDPNSKLTFVDAINPKRLKISHVSELIKATSRNFIWSQFHDIINERFEWLSSTKRQIDAESASSKRRRTEEVTPTAVCEPPPPEVNHLPQDNPIESPEIPQPIPLLPDAEVEIPQPAPAPCPLQRHVSKQEALEDIRNEWGIKGVLQKIMLAVPVDNSKPKGCVSIQTLQKSICGRTAAALAFSSLISK